MQPFRVMENPWGDPILVGMAWDILWLAVGGAVIFMALHAYYARKGKAHKAAAASVAGLPERITRHGKSARYSHWVLAAATLTLLITSFVPILGLDFPGWLTAHWVAGIVLGSYIVYHIVDTLVRLSWARMWIGVRDTVESFSRTRSFMKGTDGDPAQRPGKWGIENKIFHHLTAVAGFGVVLTGILMMLRIDTWFWAANPYFRDITDSTVGWIFVIHGASAIGFVGLVMAHLYLALRPDKLWFTRSMFKGWITREEYVNHFNPARWRVAPGAEPVEPEAVPAGVGAPSSSTLAGTRE